MGEGEGGGRRERRRETNFSSEACPGCKQCLEKLRWETPLRRSCTPSTLLGMPRRQGHDCCLLGPFLRIVFAARTLDR